MILLVLLVVVWVVVLAPAALRRLAERRRGGSIDHFHHELQLLVDAGLSPVEALRSATILAAQQFGLADRGIIAPGRRADLVLIDGDPVQDIRAVSKIAAVWCAGLPVAGVPGRTEETR